MTRTNLNTYANAVNCSHLLQNLINKAANSNKFDGLRQIISNSEVIRPTRHLAPALKMSSRHFLNARPRGEYRSNFVVPDYLAVL